MCRDAQVVPSLSGWATCPCNPDSMLPSPPPPKKRNHRNGGEAMQNTPVQELQTELGSHCNLTTTWRAEVWGSRDGCSRSNTEINGSAPPACCGLGVDTPELRSASRVPDDLICAMILAFQSLQGADYARLHGLLPCLILLAVC